SKYEDRRKAKEARLKQREQKLENRLLEYRNRLKETSQEHGEAVENLKQSLADEKKQMQETIDSLRMRIASIEQFSNTDSCQKQVPDASGRPPTTTQNHDSGGVGSRSSSGEQVKHGPSLALERNMMDRSIRKT